ncbi:MAG: fatty acid desaturase family protein [Rhodospirillales bacterium]
MAAIQQVRPFSLFSDEQWAALTRRSGWRGLLLVAHAWALIAAASALVAIWPNPLTWLIAVMVVGTRQLGLAILMHEAAHGTLHPNTAVNAFLGEYLCAAPVGADLARYRPYHLKHHRFTQQDEDPDLVLSAPFPTTRASLKRKIIRDLTGQTFYKQRIAPLLHAGATTHSFVGDTGRAQRRFLAATAAIFAIYWACGAWFWFFGVWVVAYATWYPLVTRIRNIAEHACTSRAPDPFTVARTTKANWLERLLIAPYYVHYHAEHHLFIAVPCYRLPLLHRSLADRGLTQQMNLATSYVAVLRNVAPQ